ncbi:trypsin-like peptidase domain-containing protein [Geomonas paludis]|uniref:Trypsin-like peptidase domain-containing protein n=1 Tax=Geomonas paludis TaxID=2740185 RepID=A0ABY4LJR3_9BACT|nr:trypsin-like peptidase domain-containing protein [Geomonas paludis]UPU38206.1 trypsin-like peptidase domain-containing protein [Geomonas paludis]
MKNVMPAVVGIGIDKRTRVGYRFSGNDSYWNEFQKYYKQEEKQFRQKGQPQWEKGQDTITVEDIAVVGSGFIVAKDGTIVTAQHVIDGHRSVYITTWDNKVYRAKLARQSKEDDIAILTMEVGGGSFPFMPMGNSDNLEIAEPVIAIGNPFGITFTVTSGIVSALNRTLGEGTRKLIQTDAPLNPGNSGGPLLNLNGEVIGISDAIYSPGKGVDGEAFNVGLAFAVPVNRAKDLLAAATPAPGSGSGGGVYLGIGLKNSAQDAVVDSVDEGSPAARAGMEPGDLIVGVDGRRVAGADAVLRLLRGKKPGETATLTIARGEKLMEIRVRLSQREEG